MYNKFKSKQKILIADSCAGVIAILSQIIKFAPNNVFIFLADGQKNPFGLKTKKEIINIVEDWLEYARQNNFDVLIIACNTASIAIHNNIELFQEKYHIAIITMVDIFFMNCKKNALSITNKNIVLFGTKFTVESDLYMSILNSFKPKMIYRLAGTESEKLVARGLFGDKNQILKATNEIAEFSNQPIDTFILSCTCFEFVKDIITDIYKNIIIVNLNNISENSNKKSKSFLNDDVLKNVTFGTTGEIDIWNRNINIITEKKFNQKIEVQKIKIR